MWRSLPLSHSVYRIGSRCCVGIRSTLSPIHTTYPISSQLIQFGVHQHVATQVLLAQNYNYSYFQHCESDFSGGRPNNITMVEQSEEAFTTGMSENVQNLGDKE